MKDVQKRNVEEKDESVEVGTHRRKRKEEWSRKIVKRSIRLDLKVNGSACSQRLVIHGT